MVNVMGEVVIPGTYWRSSFSMILNALYRAGGVPDIGNLRSIRVMRAGKAVGTLDIYSYILRGNIGKDIRLEKGDVVIVPPYELLVDITGKVKRPMSYEMKSDESVALLLDDAGGIKLEKALANSGSDDDMVLRKGDRLVVPEYVSTVNISGEVMYTNTVLYLKREKHKILYRPGRRICRKCKAYIIYMNGTVSRAKSLINERIEPGHEIIIPAKRDHKGISFTEIVGLATSAASIGTFTK